MKKQPLKILLFVTCIFIASVEIFSQETAKSQKLIDSGFTELTGREPIDSVVIRILRANAPTAFNAPGAPRFAIVGNDNKFYLGIGGYVKGTISYDFENPIENPMYFIVGDIPTDNSKKNTGKFNMSFGSSNIFFNFVGMPGSKYQVGAYVDFNFENDDYMFDLQYAYITVGGFLFGYNFTTFSDQSVVPPTIDMEGPPVLPSVQNTVLNYTYRSGKWSIGAGIEMPVAGQTFNDYTSNLDQKIPAIPAFVQYAWDEEQSSIRLSGLWHNMQYLDLVNDKTKNDMGWGIQLTGKLKMSNLTAYYLGLYGKGINSFIQDLNGRAMDMLPDPDKDGKLKLVEMWGGLFCLQYNFTENLFVSCNYSHLRNYTDRYIGGTTPWDEHIRYEQYAAGNLFWSITANTQVGIEYIWGRKVLMSDQKNSNNRIQAMWQFNF